MAQVGGGVDLQQPHTQVIVEQEVETQELKGARTLLHLLLDCLQREVDDLLHFWAHMLEPGVRPAPSAGGGRSPAGRASCARHSSTAGGLFDEVLAKLVAGVPHGVVLGVLKVGSVLGNGVVGEVRERVARARGVVLRQAEPGVRVVVEPNTQGLPGRDEHPLPDIKLAIRHEQWALDILLRHPMRPVALPCRRRVQNLFVPRG